MKVFNIVFVLLCFWRCNISEERSAATLRQRISKDFTPVSESLRGKINPDTSYLEILLRQYGLVNIRTLDTSIKVDLRYSDTNNFTRKNIYDGLRNAYFPCEVANRLCNAQYFLRKYNSKFSLCILDAVRPLHIQQMMWDSLRMPADKKYNYLAAPYAISLHNYGCAVDITIVNELNKELEMGTPFDSFEKLSEPVYEHAFRTKGVLSDTALQNRKLLREVMRKAGFSPINSEWWHFNYCSKETAALKFSLVK